MRAQAGNDSSSWRAGLIVLIAAVFALHATGAHAQTLPDRGSVVEAGPISLLPDRAPASFAGLAIALGGTRCG